MADEGGREVILARHGLFGFGFSFVGGSQAALPLVVSDILDGSPADLCDQLEIGDILLTVNRINVSLMTHGDVLNLLCDGGVEVTLKVKPGLLNQASGECLLCHGSEEGTSDRRETGWSNENRLTLQHKGLVDCDVTFNVKHSLIHVFSPPEGFSAGNSMEHSSAVPLCLETSILDCVGKTQGKGGNNSPDPPNRCLNGSGLDSARSAGQVRMEPRFETFLMTGDMMIKTTKIPAVSRVRRDPKAKVSENLEPPDSQATSNFAEDVQSSCGELLHQGTWVSGTLPDVVRKDYFAAETHSALNQDTSKHYLPREDDESPEGSIPEFPRCPDFDDFQVELDIPPDDISSDDERFQIEAEREFNADDLPPPPDEFLTDFKQLLPLNDEDSTLDPGRGQEADFELPDSGGAVFLKSERGHCSADVIVKCPTVKSVVISSRSEDSLPPRTSSDSRSVFSHDVTTAMHGSRSQGSYLQYGADGIVVETDLGDQASTSVGTLHCQKPCSSLDSLDPAHNQAGKNTYGLPNQVECPDSIGFQSAFDANTSKVETKCDDSGDNITETYFGSDIAPPESFGLSDSGMACTSLTRDAAERGDVKNSESIDVKDEPFNASLDVGGMSTNCQVSNINRENCGKLQTSDDIAKVAPLNDLGPQSPSSGGTGEPFGVIGEGELEDESFRMPCKDVDRPSAHRLAQRLFDLKGFQKKDVAKHLGKKNEFAQLVGQEYLKHFDFTSQSLDAALRSFLQRLVLSGETQERERILVHFSHRYVECNPNSFSSEDACHTLTCALMLLNTDLHTQNIGHKMTADEFIENLADLNDGENFPKDLLRTIYRSIQNEPIEVEEEELEDFRAGPKGNSFTLGSNPFLDVSDPSKATEFKTGCVMRKCCLDHDGRRTGLGRRSWKMFYASLRDMVLYLYKDDHGMKQQTHFLNSNNALRIHHSLATTADDYRKKHHVFRLQTSDGAEYLFQTGDSKECESWIDEINYVTAAFSSPPLPCAVGSQRKFQRPLMPSSHTKLSPISQLHHHQTMLVQIETELAEHRNCPPDRSVKSRIIQDYMDKESYLEFERKRFTTYCSILESNLVRQGILSESETTGGPASSSRSCEETTISRKESQNLTAVQRSKSDRYSYKAAILSQPNPDPEL